jgi:hypothetical protein
MFEMSDAQSNAFTDATNGMTSKIMCDFILIMIGAVATWWLFMAFIGLFKRKDVSVYESMYDFAWAIALYILTGVICYFN